MRRRGGVKVATKTLKSEGEQLRQVGRPRSRPAEADALDAREHILEVAGTLFSSQGYSATSTRQIADVVGLRQASLFHYFEKKEDILSELLYRTLRPGLALSNWLEHSCDDPYVALYALAKFDCLNLATSPNNVAALQLLPEVREERFAPFWNDRDALRRGYRSHIRSIIDLSGVDLDPELSCDLVLGLVESVLTWLDHETGPLPEIVATSVAEASMRIMSAPIRKFGAITREATALLERYASEP
jgi:AcrR family transcriptional regulator